MDRLTKAKSTGRHCQRDATLILLAYRRGFRVSDLVSLKWDQIYLKQGQFAVARAKNGSPSTHPPTWTRNPRSKAPKAFRWKFTL